jgi:DNA-binding response OmpR family regulator
MKGAPHAPDAAQVVSVVFIAADPTVSREHGLRLRKDGFSVVEASTVEAARSLCQDLLPDLVILDLGSSSGDRLAVLRELQAEPHLGSAPLVVIGAFHDLADMREGLKLGARDYLIRDETTPSLVARRMRSWLNDPARRAMSSWSPRPAAGRTSTRPAAPAAPSPGLGELFRGAFVGLIVVLLKETIFLMVGRNAKRA